MKKIKIQERSYKIINYLKKRNLEKLYVKAKLNLELGNSKLVDFKLRKPKELKIYSFRINKKYRAFGIFKDSKNFLVFEINDHQ